MKTAVFLVSSFLLLPLTVFASVHLPRTGQVSSYSPGDDGEIQTGLAFPNPRFTDQGNGAVFDNLTGLIWTVNGNLMAARDSAFDVEGIPGDGKVSFQKALAYIHKLNAENYLGYTDWRLPNRNELASLIDFSRADPALSLYHPFTPVLSEPYWTSTCYAGNPARSWTVNLADGQIWYGDKTSNLFAVWPVRSGSKGVLQIPRTGQITCTDDTGTPVGCTGTGQDGELLAGVSWPQPRYTDEKDGTVVDNLTGLMWTWDANLMKTRDPGFDNDSSPGDGRVYWQKALDYISKLNAETFLGYNDWRLPNVLELGSLPNMEWSTPAFAPDVPFGNIQNDNYWSGNSYASDTTSAWAVSLRDGSRFFSFKDRRQRLVWPVRLARGIISGTVTHNGTGLAGVTLSLDGARPMNTLTGKSGEYSFIGLDDGVYTVTPSLTGYFFTPPNRSITISGTPVSGRDFSAACESDIDSDGVCDPFDNCPEVGNPSQLDCNGDGTGDLCDPDPYPPEICDGIDNDCDGQIDEGLTQSCSTACGTGTETCQAGAWVNCTAPPVEMEICDGIDNNCDGTIDENLIQSCSTACGTGTETCQAGVWINCTAPQPRPEICDGLDNNCNGQIDEGVANACGGCGAVPDEVCDGIDNDCDGLTDEGCSCVNGATRPCGTDAGICKKGVQTCVNGVWDTACTGEIPPVTEICGDGLDNDCDGLIDEDCLAPNSGGGTPPPSPGTTSPPGTGSDGSTPSAAENNIQTSPAPTPAPESAPLSSGGGGGGGGCTLTERQTDDSGLDLPLLLSLPILALLLKRRRV